MYKPGQCHTAAAPPPAALRCASPKGLPACLHAWRPPLLHPNPPTPSITQSSGPLPQERIVLYDPAYQPRADGRPPPLPQLAGEPPHHTRARLPYWHTGGTKNLWGPELPAIEVRAASDREARQYLDAPAFSSCTVPVIPYEFNSYNFGHREWVMKRSEDAGEPFVLR